jgi:hypothetical protein
MKRRATINKEQNNSKCKEKKKIVTSSVKKKPEKVQLELKFVSHFILVLGFF